MFGLMSRAAASREQNLSGTGHAQPNNFPELVTPSPNKADKSHLPFARPIIGPSLRKSVYNRLKNIRNSEEVYNITPDRHLYRYEVTIPRLAPEFNGFTLLQLSDPHLSTQKKAPILTVTALADYLEKNRVSADLIVVTGDLVERSGMDFTCDAVDVLQRMGNGTKKLFVMGNHDYYRGLEGVTRGMMVAGGYQELCNDWLEITRSERSIYLYGTDDATRGHPKPPDNLPGDEESVRIILTHNLDALTRQFPDKFDLALSGHTHSGEIGFGPFNGSTLLRVTGHWHNKNGQICGWKALTPRCMSYVSPGLSRHVGDWGTTPPGATLIVLRTGQRGDLSSNDR